MAKVLQLLERMVRADATPFPDWPDRVCLKIQGNPPDEGAVPRDVLVARVRPGTATVKWRNLDSFTELDSDQMTERLSSM